MKFVYKNCGASLMEKQKIDRFIDAFRSAMYHEFQVDEEGMVANAPGAQGGFSSSSPAAGPTAGFDPVMTPPKKRQEKEFKLDGRNKYVKKYISNLMSQREKRAAKKAQKNALKYNPYFK